MGLIICLGLITIYVGNKQVKLRICLLGLIIFLLGVCYFQMEALNWQQEKLQQHLKQNIKIKGKIIKVESKAKAAKYTLTNLKLPAVGMTTDKKILITHWRPEQKFKRGTKVILTTKLHRPARQRNPGGFSYRNHLRRQGIYAVGIVNDWAVKQVGVERNLVITLLFKLRRKLNQQINHYFKAPNNYLLQALLLGRKNKLPEEIKQLFEKLGSSHLLVISGFHLGLISYFIFQVTAKFSPGLRLIITELFLGGYLIVTGLQLPALRAGLLITLTLVGQYLDRRTDLYNLLAGVALIILLINPRLLFTVSFQLSLGAVAGIAYLSPLFSFYLDWLPTKIAEVMAATLAAQISLIPLLSYYFNQISLVGIIANLVLMPLISLSLVLGAVFSLASLFTSLGAKLISGGLSWLLKLSLNLANWLAVNLSVVVTIATPKLIEIIAYYLVVYAVRKLLQPVIIPYCKRYRRYFIVISLSLTLLLIGNLGIKDQNLQVTFLGVDGDAIYLQTPEGQKILVDGGKRGAAVVDFLHSRGIDNLDLIFVSHFHQDHVGGLTEVVNKFQVAKICSPPVSRKTKAYNELYRQAQQSGTKLVKLDKKDQIKLPEIKIKVLAPGKLFASSPFNNNSLVLQLIYKQFRLLFTGDIEAVAETRLIRANQSLATTVLKVPHHGSDTSSTSTLINRLTPKLAVVSVGVNNQHGHPDKEVIDRWQEQGVKVLRTDKQGAVTIITDGTSYQYRTYLN